MLMSSNTSFLDHQNLHLWRKIGEGSFSKVYLTRYGDIVEDKVTLIATKVINKSRVSEKFVEKFLPRELDILLKLRHPFIVRVYSIYQNVNKIYINMEYADNGDMFTFLRTSTLTEPQIRSLFIQILWAFKYMHGVGVVHRDLKCENILLTNNYNVRIADFGFARFVAQGRNPGAATVCGTLAYSSPELVAGTRPYNPVASDVWAIGVVLYMMANNVAPFRDKNKEEMYKKQMTRDYAFRKMLDRSDALKEFTAMFLEPDLLLRLRIKNALQNHWIKMGKIRTPDDVHDAFERVEVQKNTMYVPIISSNTLKNSKLQYEITEYVKLPSVFNEEFEVAAEIEELAFL